MPRVHFTAPLNRFTVRFLIDVSLYSFISFYFILLYFGGLGFGGDTCGAGLRFTIRFGVYFYQYLHISSFRPILGFGFGVLGFGFWV